MLPKKCRIEVFSTCVNIILGPYRVFDPTRYLSEITTDSRYGLVKLYNSSDYKGIYDFLDGTVELGKDRSKRYICLQCLRHNVPTLKSTGKKGRDIEKEDYLKHVSKTGLIKFARKIGLYDKKEIQSIAKLIMNPKESIDIYNLNEYFLGTYLDTVLQGNAEFPKSNKYQSLHFSQDLEVLISLYISRKQGWI